MRYGLLSYLFPDKNKKFNLGDYVQSIAARQYLPQVDLLVNREELPRYASEGEFAMIMNGWFMTHPEQWPPPDNLKPLFVSFHISPSSAEVLLEEKSIAYFRKHGLIGCRDTYTVERLREKGIEAEFTSCLTTTLGETYRWDGGSSGEVLMVDAGYNVPAWREAFRGLPQFAKALKNGTIWQPNRKRGVMTEVLGRDAFRSAVTLGARFHPSDYPTDESRFELADEYLKRYSRAKLVVTSRIHCALPCLAIGTPMIFIAAHFSKDELSRIGDLIRFMNCVEVGEDGAIRSNFDLDKIGTEGFANPEAFRPYAQKLVERCRQFVRENSQPQ